MKILAWVQDKLNGRCQQKKPPSSLSANIQLYHLRREPCNEEFSDWPHGLLSIGTFGDNNDNENKSKHTHLQRNPSSSPEHLQELTPEEARDLQNELDLILLQQDGIKTTCLTESDNKDLGLEENSRNEDTCSEKSGKDCHTQRSASVVAYRRTYKDMYKIGSAINKKSLSFFLKKMLVCGSGFMPNPSLRDQVVPESRMEEILRAIIHKKICPQNRSPIPTMSTTKYLENKQKTVSAGDDDDVNDKADDGSKWVKTDSEYIVLEI